MNQVVVAGIFICLLPLLFLLFLLGGLLLRAICSLLNTRTPDLLLATGLVFFETVMISVLAAVVVSAFNLPGFPVRSDDLVTLEALSVGLVLTMFAAASLYTGTIPDLGYAKALAIYWLQVALGLGLLAFGAMVAMGIAYFFP